MAVLLVGTLSLTPLALMVWDLTLRRDRAREITPVVQRRTRTG
jgi:hypothetical protein